jgi:hypothetical protein
MSNLASIGNGPGRNFGEPKQIKRMEIQEGDYGWTVFPKAADDKWRASQSGVDKGVSSDELYFGPSNATELQPTEVPTPIPEHCNEETDLLSSSQCPTICLSISSVIGIGYYGNMIIPILDSNSRRS